MDLSNPLRHNPAFGTNSFFLLITMRSVHPDCPQLTTQGFIAEMDSKPSPFPP
jgi:hypothetical protein